MWLGMALLGIACRLPAEDNIPAPRVLSAREWAGVQAAHEDPRPAVRKAAAELMRYGAGGDFRGGLAYAGEVDSHYFSIPFIITPPASLPTWALPPPNRDKVVPPLANTVEGRWAQVKREAGWSGYYFDRLNPAVHAPIAAALLENEDPALVEEALKALEWMKARDRAPQIAPLVFHRDEDIAGRAIAVLGAFRAKDFADMLVVLAETRPALRREIMSALTACDDKRAIPIAFALLNTDAAFDAARVLKHLGGPEHGPAIAARLSSDDEDVQISALKMLAAVKALNEADMVVRLLEPVHPQRVRKQAIITLGELKASQFSARIAALLSDDDMGWLSLEALGMMRAAEHAAAVEALLAKAAAGALQVQCVRTLYRMGAISRPAAVKKLESVVRETDYRGWWASNSLFIELDAVESLETFLRLKGEPIPSPNTPWGLYPDSPPDVLYKLGFAARPSEIAWFLQSPEQAVVRGALKVLAEFRAVEFMQQITALLSPDMPEAVKREAMDALYRLRGKTAAVPVAALLNSGEPMALRKRALSLLEYLDAESVVAQIAALLVPEVPNELRRPALKLFAGLKGAEPYADQLFVLTTADLPLDERLEALEVLLTVSPAKGLERLGELLRPAVPKDERLAVLGMLQAKPVKQAAPLIAALLAEEDEQILDAALDALAESGDDKQVDQVLPLLGRQNWNLQYKAAEVLCELGPRGRSRLFEEATDPLLRGLAMTAMLGDQEADSAKMMNPGRVSPDALVARAVYWAKRREQGGAPALAESLLHDHAAVRAASLAALMVCGGEPAANVVPSCVEASLRFPDEAGSLLLAGYLFSSLEERAVLPWIGGRSEDSRPAVFTGVKKAREMLILLRGVWQRPDAQQFPHMQRDAALRAEEVIRSALTEWTAADLPLLKAVAADLQAMPFMKANAAAVEDTVREVRARTPLRRALRWSAWIVSGQLVLWLVVLLIYPWSAAAQRMMWSRALRRGLGWWVEPLVLRIPWLRARMWRPFREQLVPPGEVLTFDEWTFFDAVRIAPDGGAPCAALPVLRLWRGVGVLRGDSGLGKTTLLQALVSAAARPAVLLRAVECREGLTAAIQARLPQGVRGDAAFMRALLVRGSPDVYVDAVQEAPAEVQARLTTDAESLQGANILFTTQPCAWTPPAGEIVWDVQPLRAADIAPFLLKQGTAAIEAAGGQSLAERQQVFTGRVQTFLDELSALPPDDPRAAAQRGMLSNPMEAVLAAELLAAGQTPDPARLLEQRMEHLAEDFAAEQGGAFPARPLAAHLLAWRQSGRPDPDLEDFAGVASFLARHRLLRKAGETGWRFRHDKILDWFLRPALAV